MILSDVDIIINREIYEIKWNHLYVLIVSQSSCHIQTEHVDMLQIQQPDFLYKNIRIQNMWLKPLGR